VNQKLSIRDCLRDVNERPNATHVAKDKGCQVEVNSGLPIHRLTYGASDCDRVAEVDLAGESKAHGLVDSLHQEHVIPVDRIS
jgi:hypothetical protein